MSTPLVPTYDVIVVGGGAIGSAVAWRCAQRGLSVTVIESEPERGAWRTAAGMLAPITELHYAEAELLTLNLHSLAMYPSFAEELTALTGLRTGLLECGTVSVAWDGADLVGLRDLHAFATGLGVASELLSGRELHMLEPGLAPGLPGGLRAAGDHQVEPRLLHAALVAAGAAVGVHTIVGTARLNVDDDRVVGVTAADRTVLSAGHVVLAAGAWAGQILGLPPDLIPPVRPVKGQTIRMRLPGKPRLHHVVRGTVKGSAIYLVPRADGQILIGASSEEVGFDQRPRVGAVYELLRDAQSLFPELSEATLDDISTGFRPGSPDNAPLVGESGIDGLIYATGHYRNGILLTPVTANGIAELITTGSLPAVLAPFSPARFRSQVRS